MGRGDAQERQQRRALEDVETALRRNQVEAAVEGLLKLDAAARAGVLPVVARRVRDEVRKAFATRQWARLQMFAARADRERGLLSAGGSEAEELEARWALLWGSALSKDWARARAQLEGLRPGLAAAPALSRALEAWVSASGQPSREAFGELVVPDSASDPRLGFERRQQPPRKEPPGPQRLEGLEPSVLSCFASRPWPAFAATVMDWVKSAPVEVARRIWIVAAQLTVRELLAQLPAGARRAAEPALFIARACREAGAPPELSTEMLLALKVATTFFQRGKGADRDAAVLYAPIAEAATLYPDLAPLVAQTVVDTPILLDARPQMLGLMEVLARRSAAAALWAKGLRLYALPGPNAAGAIPRWLVTGLERILEREGELAEHIRALPPKERSATLDPLFGVMPTPLLEQVLEQLWPGADDALQRELAVAFDQLLLRARSDAPRSRERPGRERDHERVRAVLADHGIDVDLDRAAVDRMLEDPEVRRLMAALDDDGVDEREPLQGDALRLWRRFGERALPHNIRFLEIALVHAGSPREQCRFVEQYFAGRASITAELKALRAAMSGDCPIAYHAVHDRVVTGHRGDREALATGLLAARQMDAPRELLRALAKALTDADAAATGPRSAVVDAALLEARLFAPRPRRPRAKQTKPPKPPKPPTNPRAKPGQAGKAKAKPPAGSGPTEPPRARTRQPASIRTDQQLELSIGPQPSGTEPKP